jgi:hypothetical protein
MSEMAYTFRKAFVTADWVVDYALGPANRQSVKPKVDVLGFGFKVYPSGYFKNKLREKGVYVQPGSGGAMWKPGLPSAVQYWMPKYKEISANADDVIKEHDLDAIGDAMNVEMGSFGDKDAMGRAQQLPGSSFGGGSSGVGVGAGAGTGAGAGGWGRHQTEDEGCTSGFSFVDLRRNQPQQKTRVDVRGTVGGGQGKETFLKAMEAKQQQHQQQLGYSASGAFTLDRDGVGVRVAPGESHRVQVKIDGNWVSAVGKVPTNGQRVRVTGSSTSQLIGMKSWTSEVSGHDIGGEDALQQVLRESTEHERQEQTRIEQERVLQEQERAVQEQARQEQERLVQEHARIAQEQARQDQERIAQEQARIAQERVLQEQEQARQEQARQEQERALEEQEQAQARDAMQVRTQVIRLYKPMFSHAIPIIC